MVIIIIIIKANFIKDDGRLLLIFNCNFSSLFANCPVSGSMW